MHITLKMGKDQKLEEAVFSRMYVGIAYIRNQ